MTVHIKDQFFTKNPILLSRIYFTDNKLLCISAFNSRTLNISWKQQHHNGICWYIFMGLTRGVH